MKATLEFNLPEDRDQFECAQNGWKHQSIIEAMDAWLRNNVKYSEQWEPAEKAAFSLCQDKMRDLREEYEA